MKPTKQIIEEIEREYEVLFNGKCAFPMDKLYPVRVKTYIMKDYIPSILSAFAEEVIGSNEEIKDSDRDEDMYSMGRNDLRADQRLKMKEILEVIK